MGLFDRFKDNAPKKAGWRKIARGQRSYAAAIVDRLRGDFDGSTLSINEELRSSLSVMRSRSRQLERDNDYARKFLSMVGQNVIGPQGIRLQMRVRDLDGSLDTMANERIERAWVKWGKNCSMDGRLSWCDVQNLFIKTVARDGEAVLQFVNTDTNPFGFAVALFEPDHLDETLWADALNGNKIKMSVEVDAWSKPVAYWFQVNHPGENVLRLNGRKYTRVAAEDMLHSFVVTRAGQVRGVPWLHTAINRLKMLGG